MAGLLDSDWVKFLAAPRAYYRDKAAQQSAEQFGGLLGTLQEQAGPSQPGQQGLLAARQPDAQFWLQAAKIPGYESLAGQQLGIEAQGAQAMQRQTQGQDWSMGNLTQAQRQQLALEQQKAQHAQNIAEQNLARQWYGTEASAGASRASAESSRQSGILSGLKATEQQFKNSLLGDSAGPWGKLTGQQQVEGAEKMSIIDRAVAGAIDVADWAKNRATAAALPGFAGTSEANVMKQEWQFGVKPVVMQMLNTGVLQPAEEEMVQGLIGKPDDYVLTDSQLNSIQNMMQKVQDRREDMYKSYGRKAQPIGLGQSAAARSLNAGKFKPAGELKDVTTRPGGNTYSGTVDRSR